MGAILIHDRPFFANLGHYADIKLLQITQPAMNKLCRSTRCSRRKVLHINQTNLHAPRSGVESNSSASNSAADNEQVKRRTFHILK
ncbi:hypothetical protein D3C77_433940 [compost metagenome]